MDSQQKPFSSQHQLLLVVGRTEDITKALLPSDKFITVLTVAEAKKPFLAIQTGTWEVWSVVASHELERDLHTVARQRENKVSFRHTSLEDMQRQLPTRLGRAASPNALVTVQSVKLFLKARRYDPGAEHEEEVLRLLDLALVAFGDTVEGRSILDIIEEFCQQADTEAGVSRSAIVIPNSDNTAETNSSAPAPDTDLAGVAVVKDSKEGDPTDISPNGTLPPPLLEVIEHPLGCLAASNGATLTSVTLDSAATTPDKAQDIQAWEILTRLWRLLYQRLRIEEQAAHIQRERERLDVEQESLSAFSQILADMAGGAPGHELVERVIDLLPDVGAK